MSAPHFKAIWRHFAQNYECEPHSGAEGKSEESLGIINLCIKFQVNPADVETFQSGPKRWAN